MYINVCEKSLKSYPNVHKHVMIFIWNHTDCLDQRNGFIHTLNLDSICLPNNCLLQPYSSNMHNTGHYLLYITKQDLNLELIVNGCLMKSKWLMKNKWLMKSKWLTDGYIIWRKRKEKEETFSYTKHESHNTVLYIVSRILCLYTVNVFKLFLIRTE